MALPAFATALAVLLFAVFPLTDTDIWWHLACAREWVTTWTPVRTPVINVHEFYQQVVYFIYNIGGAPALVGAKSLLWGLVFWLFARKARFSVFTVLAIFIFRYQLEIRPVLFSLLFLGTYWNAVPWLEKNWSRKGCVAATVIGLLAIQWIWCRTQGLYILGPIFVLSFGIAKMQNPVCRKWILGLGLLLLCMPFLHGDGLGLFLYPFGLLDRLLGLSDSATVFASGIAENRSPLLLLAAGENVLQSSLMILLSISAAVFAVIKMARAQALLWRPLWVLLMSLLALVAERNFILLLPLLVNASFADVSTGRLSVCRWLGMRMPARLLRYRFAFAVVLCCCVLGFWCRSLLPYDKSMVAYQRVPVAAAEWMKNHPHEGRLFNDDRAGGYLAFVNPADSVYIDGRFILKTSEFFERYLQYGEQPELFLSDARLQNMDRVVLPIRYYARWDKLFRALEASQEWALAYVDNYYAVLDRKNIH